MWAADSALRVCRSEMPDRYAAHAPISQIGSQIDRAQVSARAPKAPVVARWVQSACAAAMAAKKRKKNPGVGIDFKRAKLKVGKKLPKARNATDTSFKAQSIALPGQDALTQDRSCLATSDRNLTLKVGGQIDADTASTCRQQCSSATEYLSCTAVHRSSWARWGTTASASGGMP